MPLRLRRHASVKRDANASFGGTCCVIAHPDCALLAVVPRPAEHEPPSPLASEVSRAQIGDAGVRPAANTALLRPSARGQNKTRANEMAIAALRTGE